MAGVHVVKSSRTAATISCCTLTSTPCICSVSVPGVDRSGSRLRKCGFEAARRAAPGPLSRQLQKKQRYVLVEAADGEGGSPVPSGEDKIPFGYTRKDVILIGVGITVFGFGLRYGLEYWGGLDGFQAGSVVQLVVVLGLCLGWVSTYLWRVGNKEMTYAQQLRDYENAVMEKRLEALSETELEAMLAEVEEEKQRLRAKKANMKE